MAIYHYIPGAQPSPGHHGAAVVVLKAYNQGGVGGLGLARLVQTTPNRCVVDATIDGLPEGHYQVKVHEYGDMSQGCDRLVPIDISVSVYIHNVIFVSRHYCVGYIHFCIALVLSCGDVFTVSGSAESGSLGTIMADGTGRATFQTFTEHFHVWDLIGRSIVIHSPERRYCHSLY